MNPFSYEALARDREAALSRQFARSGARLADYSALSAAQHKIRRALRGVITGASSPDRAQSPGPLPHRPHVVVRHGGSDSGVSSPITSAPRIGTESRCA